MVLYFFLSNSGPASVKTIQHFSPTANLEELRKQEEEERENLSLQLEDLKERRTDKLDAVEHETNQFTVLKQQSAEIAINSRTGKAITPKVRWRPLLASRPRANNFLQLLTLGPI